MKSCLLSGVGGQGTVLASRVLAQAAMNQGLFARTAETIGMAQRGGCVVSHVRMGEQVASPLIPLGGADVLIGFEPGEAVRCLPYLKPQGLTITADRPIHPVTGSLNQTAYDAREMLEYLKEQVDRLLILPADAITQACGSPRVLNVALLGAAAATGELGLSQADILAVLSQRLRPQYLPMNEKALSLGATYAKEAFQ